MIHESLRSHSRPRACPRIRGSECHGPEDQSGDIASLVTNRSTSVFGLSHHETLQALCDVPFMQVVV